MPLEIHIQGFDITNLESRMQAMARPCYSALTNHAGDKPSIVFVPSKRHARQTAVDLWAYASADGKGDKFLQVSLDPVSVVIFQPRVSSQFPPCISSPAELMYAAGMHAQIRYMHWLTACTDSLCALTHCMHRLTACFDSLHALTHCML